MTDLVPVSRCSTPECRNTIAFEGRYRLEHGLVLGPKSIQETQIGAWCQECARRLANQRRPNTLTEKDSAK